MKKDLVLRIGRTKFTTVIACAAVFVWMIASSTMGIELFFLEQQQNQQSLGWQDLNIDISRSDTNELQRDDDNEEENQQTERKQKGNQGVDPDSLGKKNVTDNMVDSIAPPHLDFAKQVMAKEDKREKSATPQIAIFFNTFSTVNDTQLARDIIVSQLEDINSQPLLNGAPLYYSRIGNLDWDWPLSECQGGSSSPSSSRVCTQIIATPTGHEELTLQPLYDYCINNREKMVVYLHSKGTFNVSEKQNNLRQVLMKAITSTECLVNMNADHEEPNQFCHTCSARFSFFPNPAYCGNMWVAQCSYVSKLVPPSRFESSQSNVIESMRNNTKEISNREGFITKLDNYTSYKFSSKNYHWIERESWIGTGRYASEHWIGSHPDLKPCEAFPSKDFPPIVYGNGRRRIFLHDFQSPRLGRIQETIVDIAEGFWNDKKTRNLVQNPWYRKDGKLYLYKSLYSKVPPDDSWFYTVWDQFQVPDSWDLKTSTSTKSIGSIDSIAS